MRLIPCESISKISLSRRYDRNTQNAGLLGRPRFLPCQQEVSKYLNEYLNSQSVAAGGVPKLSKVFSFPIVTLDTFLPHDNVENDASRQQSWKRFQSHGNNKNLSRRSLNKSSPPDHVKPTVLGFGKKPPPKKKKKY